MASYAALKKRVDLLMAQDSGALTFGQAFKLVEQKHRVRGAIRRKMRHYSNLPSGEAQEAQVEKLRALKEKLAKLQPLALHREEFLKTHPNVGKKKAKSVLPAV